MRKIKRVLAVISMAAALAVSAMPVSAYNTNWTGYDINNPEYIEYVDKLGGYLPNKIIEDAMVRGYNENKWLCYPYGKGSYGYEWAWECKHIMGGTDKFKVSDDPELKGYISFGTNIELGNHDDVEAVKGKKRTFAWVQMDLNWFEDKNDINIEEVQALFKEKQFKATAEYRKTDLKELSTKAVVVKYDKDITLDELTEIIHTLDTEFNLLPDGYVTFQSAGEQFTEKAEPTLKGDATLDGRVDLADLTVVAKYNLNNEAYPLANDTAYANADMNGDGVVDGLDTSSLIENQLGKKDKE